MLKEPRKKRHTYREAKYHDDMRKTQRKTEIKEEQHFSRDIFAKIFSQLYPWANLFRPLIYTLQQQTNTTPRFCDFGQLGIR